MVDDAERQRWVNNDQILYNNWQQSGMGLYRFVKLHRREIDAYIHGELNKEPKGLLGGF
jgi:hypothetical protein